MGNLRSSTTSTIHEPLSRTHIPVNAFTMNHLPQAWGRPRDDVYGAYDASYLQGNGPNQHTQSPVVTGTSVLAIKFKDGVVIAADNLASYGSLARFTDVKRLRIFAETTVVGFGGDVSGPSCWYGWRGQAFP